jgi:hypothetical protein
VNVLLHGVDIQIWLLILAALLFGFWYLKYEIGNQEIAVERWLTLAEREFNRLVSSGLSHGGRKDKVEERRVWNEMARIPEGVQINAENYRSAAHYLIELNEKDIAGKGTAMGRATDLAFLLRFLYEGDVKAAQAKIFVDARNNDWKVDYMAPGIYELVGFDKFEKEKGFPEGAGVERWLLKRVVRARGFPKDIRMVQTDNSGRKTVRYGTDALVELVQQNP